MTNATTNVARVAAAVAGLGLVAMSFAPLAGAQTTATTTTTTTTTATFTRDLTIGSTGADVTALQTWLIGKGFSIPAGATGYFGAQTKAALGAFQAANMISPAAGYFGPITRAKLATMGGSTTTGGTTTTTGTLSGGEADLRNFDLLSGENLMEGDSNVEIAVAKFDVKGGDAEIQRVTVDVQAVTATTYSEKPWDYIDTLSVYDGSKKVGEVDAGSKSDWSNEDDDSSHNGASGIDYYTLDIPVNDIVREGDTAELSIRADAQSSIDNSDQSQTFKVQVPTDGIRAVDAKGIQQYVGDGEEITLGFDAAENGDLTVKKSSDNPDAGVLVVDTTSTSDTFDVLGFEIKNKDNADADFNKLTFTVATTSSAGPDTDITDIIRRATLTLDGDDYTGDVKANNTIVFDNLNTSVSGDDTIDGTLSIELFGQTSHYAADQSLKFTLPGDTSHVDAEGADTGDSSTVGGSAVGNKQSLSVDAGINVSGNSDNAVLTYNSNDTTKSYGTYTLKFDVTANGDDVYVPKSASTTAAASSTVGVWVDTDINATFAGTSTISISSTADTDSSVGGPSYIVRDGDTETFTVTLTLDPSATGTFAAGLDKVRFSTSGSLSSLQTLDIDQTQSEFQTDALSIQN